MSTPNVKPLQPQLPPGRASRKALAYTSEIHRLRGLGYTYEAIRLALLDVGVAVGLTTVKREAARGVDRSNSPPIPSRFAQTGERAPPPPAVAPDGVPVTNRRSGKEIAETFAQSHIDNPLLKPQPASTASRDEPR